MARRAKKFLVTGGAGFIGSEFVRTAVQSGRKVIVVDKLTYAGDLSRLRAVKGQYKFYKADISKLKTLNDVFKKEHPDVVVHFAAETHVDRSIHKSVLPFIETNIIGTQNLIDLSRRYHVKKFIHVATDEVYGEIKSGQFYEHSQIKPNNPYSATKAAADHLIKAAIRTHHFPALIARPSNNYGPWQYPEKLIPVVILKALHHQRVPVYGKGKNVREWLHVSDCISAINLLIRKGKVGETYNIGSHAEKQNIYTVKQILKALNKPESLIQFVKDRPGHDIRYSLNCKKIQRLGWRPKMSFSKGIHQTVNWNTENILWLENKLRRLKIYWKKVYQTK